MMPRSWLKPLGHPTLSFAQQAAIIPARFTVATPEKRQPAPTLSLITQMGNIQVPTRNQAERTLILWQLLKKVADGILTHDGLDCRCVEAGGQ
jgi:hypothetical protein